jgi:hypothetical protein
MTLAEFLELIEMQAPQAITIINWPEDNEEEGEKNE